LQKDLERGLAAEGSQEPLALLERLAQVLKGETGPYHEMRLLEGAGGTSRNRAMIAFASAKHERLFSLLDEREYDFIEVISLSHLVTLARQLVESGRFASGTEYLSRAARTLTGSEPECADIAMGLGICYASLEDRKTAKEYFELARRTALDHNNIPLVNPLSKTFCRSVAKNLRRSE
jgi:tetratricopeptide (TPR) repeat protein